MKALLCKELRLATHPTTWIFPWLSALLLVPNYPYLVTFFYTCLGVFFVCLSGRENHDVFYTLSLPVRKRDLVRARFALVITMQLVQLLLAVPFAFLRQRLSMPENAVGMEANVALFGFAFALLGLFNLCFFSIYYRNVQRVGVAFAWSSVAIGVLIFVEEACTHVVPLFRDRLDTPDPAYLAEKLVVLGIGALLYILLTSLALRRSQQLFARQDL